MAAIVVAEKAILKKGCDFSSVKPYCRAPCLLKDLDRLRRDNTRGCMDLIAIFPRVLHTKRCLPSEGSCPEPSWSGELLSTPASAPNLSSLREENDLMKQFDAAWLAGFQAVSNTSKASCGSKAIRRESNIQSSSRKAPQESLSAPVMAENSRRHGKDLKSTPKTKKRHTEAQPVVDESRGNIRLAALYLPSLTLWVLSFVAAVIWLGVFFVERQPTAQEKVHGIGTVRFAETPVSPYRQEQSRQ